MFEDVFDILIQHVSWVEAIWTLSCVAGVVRYGFGRYLTVYSIRRKYIDDNLTHNRDSTHLWLNTRAFRFLTIALIFWLWALLGLRSMLLPNPEGVTNIDQLASLILILSGVVLLFLKGEYVDHLENQAYSKYKKEVHEEVHDTKGYLLDSGEIKWQAIESDTSQ